MPTSSLFQKLHLKCYSQVPNRKCEVILTDNVQNWHIMELISDDYKLFKEKKQPPEMFLEILQNSQENTCARVSFLKRGSGTCVFL